MPESTHIVAVYPGSFDPITHGHLDVIRRAARLFNKLIVGVGLNPGKQPIFTVEERLRLIQPHIAHLRNVSLDSYEGLTMDFVRARGARVLIRGIRDIADLSAELQQANVNLAIGGIETVFLLTSDQHVMTSSTYVKQIFELSNGDTDRIRRLVPDNVARLMDKKHRPPPRRAGKKKRG